MANTKQKPKPEGTNRSPGKSRFSIPQKETPAIDGSYLDRLFADYEKQSQELEVSVSGAATNAVSPPPTAEVTRTVAPEPVSSQTPETVQDTPPVEPSAKQLLPPETGTRSQHSTGEPDAPPSSTATIQRTRREPRIAQTPAPRFLEPSDDDAILLDKLKKKHRLGKGELNVLRVMIRLCWDSGTDYCFIKIPQLMADSGLKERQTQVVLRNLRELELIEKLADYSNIDRLGTKYKVNFDSF